MAGFADLFGGMFGGGGPAPTPGLLDAAGYMDPAQYDAARRSQGMMGLWAGLLQGGGPSLEPRNFGSALGAGLGGMNKFGSTFDEDQLHAAQAAQGRANVGKLGAETEAQRAAIKLLGQADQIPTGMLPPGAAGGGTGTGGVPNFGAGTGGAGIAASEHYATAIRLGATPNEAALLTSAAGAESSFNPTAVHDGGIGYGLYGHNADRLAAMRKQFGERPGAAQQIEFALNELRSRPEGARVNAAKTPEELTELQFQFERPKRGPGDQAAARLASTRAYMQNPPTAPTGAPGAPAPGGAIPEFAGGRAGGLGGPAPVPQVVGVGFNPAAPVPGPLATGAAAPMLRQELERRAREGTSGGGSGPPVPPADAGGDGAGPQFGYGSAGGAITPAALAAAAAAQGAPQVPAAAVALAPAVPPAPPAAAAAAPAPSALAPGTPQTPMQALIPALQALQAAQGTGQAALPAPPAPARATPPPMLGVVATPPLQAAQAPAAGGAQPYNPQAHRAQMIANALALMGKPVPAHIAEAAGLPLAGQKAAQEAAARQPFELQRAQQQQAAAAQLKQWEALNENEKNQVAAQNDLTKEQFKKRLDIDAAAPIALQQLGPKLMELAFKSEAEWQAEWYKPRDYKQVDPATGRERTISLAPADLYGGVSPQQAQRAAQQAAGAAPGAAPGAPPQGPAPALGVVTGLGPLAAEELQGRGKALATLNDKITKDATDANAQLSNLKIMQNAATNLAQQGILSNSTQFANRVINSLTGQQADRVAAYELVTKNSEKLIRDVTRESDAQPAAIQLVMTRNSMPTPQTSKSGFEAVLGQMMGAQEYLLYKRGERDRWLNNPANNNSLQGFEASLPVSPYAFMIHRMPENEKAALKAKLQAAGPQGVQEMKILADQLDAITAAGF